MDDRERAVLATQVITAMKQQQPQQLDAPIAALEATPWDLDVVAILKAVRHELERQKHAAKPKR